MRNITGTADVPREGRIGRSVDSQGREYILHSCGLRHTEAGVVPDESGAELSGCVDVFPVSAEDAYIQCRSCGMRVRVPASARTWDDIQRHFASPAGRRGAKLGGTPKTRGRNG